MCKLIGQWINKRKKAFEIIKNDGCRPVLQKINIIPGQQKTYYNGSVNFICSEDFVSENNMNCVC